MKRRELIMAMAGGVAAFAGASALAEELAKPARVGIVAFGGGSESIDGLRQGLADKGYAEGRNLVIEKRFAEGDADRLPALIAELLAHRVDVLVTIGTQSALVAKRQTTMVPIVFQSGDPTGVGLVASLARPGGNLTGVSILSGEYSRKWLGLLKEAAPRLHRVAVLWNPGNPAIAEEVEQMKQAAPGLELDLVVIPVQANDIESSLAAIASTGADGIVVTDDSLLYGLAARLAAFAAERRLPMISGFDNYVRHGALMSYSVNLVPIGRRVADYVDRILKGARPAELPVEQATEFALRINLKTASALGLAIPPSLLAQADEVIE